MSLFSIELAVDKVKSVLVPCRLPVVAFRLLDFPTVVIHCVSLQRQATIGSSDGPPDLGGLTDHYGNFVFQKGKSCLFKMDFNMFCRHLRATPLYLMLLDVWNRPAQLIGSSSVRLNSVGEELMKCKEEYGICSPSSSGGRGQFEIFNLMGNRVATIELAYRVDNLGPALAAHLKKQSGQVGIKEEEKKNGIARESNMQTVSVQTTGNEIAFSTSLADHFGNRSEDTRMTQPKRNPTETPKDFVNDQDGQIEDVYITNTVCPPPLFYNSEAVDIPSSPQHITNSNEGTNEGTEDTDEEDDLDKQGKEVSEDEEDHWKSVVESEANNYPLLTIQKTVEQAKVGQQLTSPCSTEPATHGKSVTEQKTPLVDHPQFSLLTGLLSELSHLLGNQFIPQTPQVENRKSELQEGEKKEDSLQDLASLVYQRLLRQHRNQHPQPSVKKSKKRMAVPTRPSCTVETHTDSICPRAIATHSPPRPYRNLTYFARFPRKPHPVSPFPVEIPFSKPRERAVRTTNKEVNKAQPVKIQQEKGTKRIQQTDKKKLEMKTKDSVEWDEVPMTGSGSAVSAVSVEQNSSKRSIEIRLPDITVNDEMETDEFPVSEEEEISQPHVEMAMPLQGEKQEPPSVHANNDDVNQSLHIEDLKIQSHSTAMSTDHSIIEQESLSKQTARDSDHQSDVYSDQFEDESQKASSSGSDHSRSSKQTGNTTSTSRSSTSSFKSSESSSSSSTSSHVTKASRDSAIPTVHSMTNLKAIETLGYTI